MNNKRQIIIDLEFTGLDNDFIDDNEIIEIKLGEITSDGSLDTKLERYGSDKKNCVGSFLKNRIKNSSNMSRFSQKRMIDICQELKIPWVIKGEDLCIDPDGEIEFIGFSTEMDTRMLLKQNIYLDISTDISVEAQMTDGLDFRMATEGRSLECLFYYANNDKEIKFYHKGTDELFVILDCMNYITSLDSRNHFMRIMPWGTHAGYLVTDYCNENRRRADGYRFNNYTNLAAAMDEHLGTDYDDC